MTERAPRPSTEFKLDPQDTRPRPQQEVVPTIFEADDVSGTGGVKEKFSREILEKEFGKLTDEQLMLAQQDGGFLVFIPGVKKQTVAFRLQPMLNRGTITGWRVAEIAGGADLSVYVDDKYKPDLSDMPTDVKRGLDLYVRVAGDQASALTRQLYHIKETSRTKRKEYAASEGFAVQVWGGEVKLVFGTNKKGETVVRVVSVSRQARYSQGATYLLSTVPTELQSAVEKQLKKSRNAA